MNVFLLNAHQSIRDVWVVRTYINYLHQIYLQAQTAGEAEGQARAPLFETSFGSSYAMQFHTPWTICVLSFNL